MKNNKVGELIESAQAQLLEKIKDGATIEKVRSFLDISASFCNYSFRNQILIWSQNRKATRVAGFHSWKKLGRSITAGSRSIKIIAPCPYTKKDADGIEEEYINFRAVSVFDVEQTHGRELPDICDVQGNSEADTLDDTVKYAELSGAKVEFCKTGRADGWVDGNSDISISDNMAPNKQLITLFHELSHIRLGHIGSKEDKQKKEIEAEVCAYVVSKHFGIDAKSEEYLLTYKAEDEQIMDAFSHATKTAGAIIAGVEQQRVACSA